MTTQTVTLLDNAAVSGADVDFNGGSAHVMVEADAWNGATVSIDYKTPSGNYISLGADTTFTADGQAGFSAGAGLIRVSISGGPPTNVRAYLRYLPR